MKGEVQYITGGTTRRARVISYSADRWARSVAIKASILAEHGVSNSSRVAVCHPFAPWAIGQVHTEGALECGAAVLPLGLNAEQPELLRKLSEFDSTHICGAARNLIRLAGRAAQLGINIAGTSRKTLFVAGEVLTPSVRAECQSAWNGYVVDVYGLAEFDAVGTELPGQRGIVLVSRYNYAINHQGKHVRAETGATGTLAIRESEGEPWFETGDLVEVISMYGGHSAPRPVVRLLGRAGCVSLLDGSAVSEEQVTRFLEEHPCLNNIQVQVYTGRGSNKIAALCVPHAGNRLDVELIRGDIRNLNVDFEDALRQGVISELRIQEAGLPDLVATSRGKCPLVLERPEEAWPY